MPGVVKFTANHSINEVEFLDLVIKIKVEDSKRTSTSSHLTLNYDSNHPEPCKTCIVYGQALRVIERCSDTQDAYSHIENLKAKLL